MLEGRPFQGEVLKIQQMTSEKRWLQGTEELLYASYILQAV